MFTWLVMLEQVVARLCSSWFDYQEDAGGPRPCRTDIQQHSPSKMLHPPLMPPLHEEFHRLGP